MLTKMKLKEHYFKKQKKFYNQAVKYLSKVEPSKRPKPDIKSYKWIMSLVTKYVTQGKLLDVGCGAGFLLNEAEKYGYETYGIDISSGVISLAKKLCKRTTFKVTPAEKLSFKNNFFDVITCLGSLEHFLHPECVIKKIKKVLKDNGIVIILLPNCWYILDFIYRGLIKGEGQTHGQPLMERFYSKIDGKELLENNGLYVLDIKKYNKFNAPIPRKWNFIPMNILLELFWKIFRVFIPLNVSYGFCYVCKKSKR